MVTRKGNTIPSASRRRCCPAKTRSDFIQTLFGQGNAEDGIGMLIVFLLVDRGRICETTAYRQGLLGGTIKSVSFITKSFLTVPAPSIG